MWVLKACAVCLSTGVKLHNLNTGSLRHEFNSISGLKTTKRSGMPNHLCVECCAYVKKFLKFQKKCQRAYYTLQQMLASNKEIKKNHLKALNREQLGLLPSISLIDLDRAHYEAHHFKWVASKNLTNTSQFDYIPVVHYSTLTKEDTFSEVMTNTEINTKAIKTEDSKARVSNEPETRKSKRRKLVVSDDNNAETKIIDPDDTQLTDINTFLEDTKFNMDFDDNDVHNDMDTNDFAANDIISNNFASNNIKDDAENDVFYNTACQLNNKADGSVFNEEYGQMVPISVKEARAVNELDKMFMSGDHKCQCGQKFRTEERLQRHARMHDKHEKGTFHCSICDYYYKTQFLLDVHMTEKHLYKYLCQMCPEVSFNRFKAKHHYCQAHLGQQKQLKSGSKLWQDRERPAWLSRRRTNKAKKKALPRQIVKYAFDLKPISPEEQYSFVQNRKLSRNYLEAKYKCEFCFRGYRLHTTYTNHMVKHDPAISGTFQCDMCKLYFRNQRKIYKHMNMYHLSSYTCMSCDYVSTNRSQALAHYKWHKNVTYDCSHCDKKFVKASTRLTHIRLKHPSTYICNLCGHSFVSSAGLTCHRQIAHSREEMTNIAEQLADASNANYCVDCEILFASEQAFTTHLGSSSKHVNTNISVQKTQRDSRKRMRREMGVQSRAASRDLGLGLGKRSRNGSSEVHNTGVTTSNNCEVCGKYLVNDVQARRHYDTEHPGSDYLRRYMCEICGHTSKQYANLLVHMRTHTNEKPYECPHCDRRFSMLSNRDRHLVVHTGEKRFQCHHCSRRFTQSSAVKLHIQTVHLKIPYAPWDKKNRKRRKELEAAGVSDDMNLAEAPPLPAVMQQPQPKLILDTGEYINAYITYSDV